MTGFVLQGHIYIYADAFIQGVQLISSHFP